MIAETEHKCKRFFKKLLAFGTLPHEVPSGWNVRAGIRGKALSESTESRGGQKRRLYYDWDAEQHCGADGRGAGAFGTKSVRVYNDGRLRTESPKGIQCRM